VIIGTALLVPNTIATVAGNSLIQFTSDDIPLYDATIIVTTVITTIVAWGAVKPIGIFPSQPE
jgi:hypothetical protein